MVYKLITRSKGVVIFAITLIAFGTFCAFLLILSLLLISLQGIPELRGLFPADTLAMPTFWLSSAVNLFIFISWVVCGIGALHLKEWARQFLRIVMAAHIINMIINIYLNVFMAEEVVSHINMGFLGAGIAISFS